MIKGLACLYLIGVAITYTVLIVIMSRDWHLWRPFGLRMWATQIAEDMGACILAAAVWFYVVPRLLFGGRYDGP